MTGVAAYVDALPAEAARSALARCCAARRWVEAMLSRRPFGADAALYAAAEELWWDLDRADWLEAFAHHPRLGETKIDPGRFAAAAWSSREQSGAAASSPALREALAAGNQAYEARFGHVFLFCASGRSAEDMHAALRERLANDPQTELQNAAAEQAKITWLRLGKLAEEAETAR